MIDVQIINVSWSLGKRNPIILDWDEISIHKGNTYQEFIPRGTYAGSACKIMHEIHAEARAQLNQWVHFKGKESLTADSIYGKTKEKDSWIKALIKRWVIGKVKRSIAHIDPVVEFRYDSPGSNDPESFSAYCKGIQDKLAAALGGDFDPKIHTPTESIPFIKQSPSKDKHSMQPFKYRPFIVKYSKSSKAGKELFEDLFNKMLIMGFTQDENHKNRHNLFTNQVFNPKTSADCFRVWHFKKSTHTRWLTHIDDIEENTTTFTMPGEYAAALAWFDHYSEEIKAHFSGPKEKIVAAYKERGTNPPISSNANGVQNEQGWTYGKSASGTEFLALLTGYTIFDEIPGLPSIRNSVEIRYIQMYIIEDNGNVYKCTDIPGSHKFAKNCLGPATDEHICSILSRIAEHKGIKPGATIDMAGGINVIRYLVPFDAQFKYSNGALSINNTRCYFNGKWSNVIVPVIEKHYKQHTVQLDKNNPPMPGDYPGACDALCKWMFNGIVTGIESSLPAEYEQKLQDMLSDAQRAANWPESSLYLGAKITSYKRVFQLPIPHTKLVDGEWYYENGSDYEVIYKLAVHVAYRIQTSERYVLWSDGRVECGNPISFETVQPTNVKKWYKATDERLERILGAVARYKGFIPMSYYNPLSIDGTYSILLPQLISIVSIKYSGSCGDYVLRIPGLKGFIYVNGKWADILKPIAHVPDSVNKPPLGVKPLEIHAEGRLNDLRGAIQRYMAAGREIQLKWIEEYNDLIKKYGQLGSK